ncbi:MAG: universal stress protein [Pseudomonadota bacterium]|nr:universal stress protein [Pseudomonadota bacterium]
MDRITDILVIVNPLVRDQPAIAKAATLARWLGASIELLICDTLSSRKTHTEGELPALGNALLSDNVDSLLEQLAEPLRDDGIDVTTQVISGDPVHETVISWMRNSPADLVIKDTHHHSLAKRTFATNTDWHLIRACPVLLLLTKPPLWETPPVLMAAVDPGHVNDPSAALDRRILDVTVSLANRFDAQVHAVHSYLPSTITTAAVGGMPPLTGVSAEALAAERALRRSQIKRLTDEYEVADANLHVDAGSTAEYLPWMAAEWRVDILAMGATARGGLKRVLIGSTAERVLERLPCDVLVVKSPDFAKNLPF